MDARCSHACFFLTVKAAQPFAVDGENMTKKLAGLLSLLVLVATLAQAGFVTVPLNPVANRELVDNGPDRPGWTGQGKDNSLTGFPRGEQTFHGVPFAIVTQGPAALVLRSKELPLLPEAVELPVPAVKNKVLYLLATHVWTGNGCVAVVEVHYAGGGTQSILITWEDRISGWWQPHDLDRATVVWRGQNGRGVEIGAYLIPVKLTEPENAVTGLTFKATTGGGSFALLGVTLGDRPVEELVKGTATWQPVKSDATNWFSLAMSYDHDTVAAWEKGFLKPQTGWLHADGERLEFDDGTPVRFKGIVLCGPGIYPPKTAASHFVRRLVKFGFNQVRLHSIMDVLLDDNQDTRKIDLNRLDKFDNFVSELKKAGISIKPSILYAHLWGGETGVPQPEELHKTSLNNTQYFYEERHQELYLDFLRQFLAHKNPYTGLTYAQEPAFSMVKVVNECSLFFNTVDAMPGGYRIELQDKWNAWLKKKYGSDSQLLGAWQVIGESAPLELRSESLAQTTVGLRGISDLSMARPADLKRVADQTKFYYELEVQWFSKVRDVIRSTGSRTLMQGSSWGGPDYLQEIQTAANANFDFAGKHTYWDHPIGGWTPKAVSFDNQPVEKHPLDNLFNFIYQQPAGKPFTCTEWQFAWPSDYTVEAAPFMAAYGALQNLAANHHFVADDVEWPGSLNSIFGMFDNPAQMACEPLAYFLYVRGDVKSAPVIYRNALDETALHNALRKRNLRTKESETRFAMKFGGGTCPTDAAFIGRVEVSFDPKKYPAIWDEKTYQKCHDAKAKTITSVTGELIWNYDQGWIRINTPKTQGVMGQLSQQTFESETLNFTLNDAFGVVHFSSLDNLPIGKSASLFVSLVGRTRNTGQQYGKREDHYRLDKQGEAPILMEPVTAKFTLKTGVGTWRLTPLNFNGDPVPAKSVTLQAEGGVLKGQLSNKDAGTVHFLLEAVKN